MRIAVCRILSNRKPEKYNHLTLILTLLVRKTDDSRILQEFEQNSLRIKKETLQAFVKSN